MSSCARYAERLAKGHNHQFMRDDETDLDFLPPAFAIRRSQVKKESRDKRQQEREHGRAAPLLEVLYNLQVGLKRLKVTLESPEE